MENVAWVIYVADQTMITYKFVGSGLHIEFYVHISPLAQLPPYIYLYMYMYTFHHLLCVYIYIYILGISPSPNPLTQVTRMVFWTVTRKLRQAGRGGQDRQ